MFVTADEPTGVVLFEEWSSRDEHEAYMRWRMDTGLGDRLGPFMTDAPAFTFLESSRR